MDRELAPPLLRVARGLGFVFAGVAFVVIIWCTTFILETFGVVVPLPVSVLLTVLFWLAIVLHLGGQILCLRVPADAHARGPLVVAIVVNVLAKLLALANLVAVLSPWGADPAVGLVLPLSGLLLSIVSSLAFLVFLKRLSHYLGHGDGEVEAEALLFLWSVLIFLGVVLVGLTMTLIYLLMVKSVMQVLLAPDRVTLTVAILILVLGLLFLFLALVTLIRYCNLLIGLRELIKREVAIALEDVRARKSGLAPS